MREAIPMITLLQELKNCTSYRKCNPKVHCTIFEDNQSTIAIAKSPTMLPRTKHVSLKYHHFRQFMQDGSISIQYVRTDNQIADMFTKPLPPSTFSYLRQKLMGW